MTKIIIFFFKNKLKDRLKGGETQLGKPKMNVEALAYLKVLTRCLTSIFWASYWLQVDANEKQFTEIILLFDEDAFHKQLLDLSVWYFLLQGQAGEGLAMLTLAGELNPGMIIRYHYYFTEDMIELYGMKYKRS